MREGRSVKEPQCEVGIRLPTVRRNFTFQQCRIFRYTEYKYLSEALSCSSFVQHLSCSSHLHPLHDVVTVRQLTQIGWDAPQHTLDRLSQTPRHGGRVGEDGIDERPQCTGVGASHIFHVVCGD